MVEQYKCNFQDPFAYNTEVISVTKHPGWFLRKEGPPTYAILQPKTPIYAIVKNDALYESSEGLFCACRCPFIDLSSDHLIIIQPLGRLVMTMILEMEKNTLGKADQ